MENYISRIHYIGEEIKNDPSLNVSDAILLAHYVCILKAIVEERIEKGASKRRKVIKSEEKVCACGNTKPIYKGPDSTHVCQRCYRRNKKNK